MNYKGLYSVRMNDCPKENNKHIRDIGFSISQLPKERSCQTKLIQLKVTFSLTKDSMTNPLPEKVRPYHFVALSFLYGELPWSPHITRFKAMKNIESNASNSSLVSGEQTGNYSEIIPFLQIATLLSRRRS